ncbi:MAG: hypothetical protein U0175_24590 [Caldilineaceae bacterium]
MSWQHLRLMVTTLGAGLLVLLSSLLVPFTQAQAQQTDRPANSVRTLPHPLLRAQASSQNATVFPATMVQDFEGDWPAAGWEIADFGTSGGEYLLGKSDCNPESGSYAGWTVGGGADGTDLPCDADYPDNVDNVAVYGPFDLTNAVSSKVTFSLTGASELDVDGLFIGASLDDYNYCGFTYSGDYTDGYFHDTFDLSDLSCEGQPPSLLGFTNVTLAIFFFSDESITDIGFTIDNLALTTLENMPATATETPTNIPRATATETPTDVPIGPTHTPTDTPSGPTFTSTSTPTETPTDTPTSTPTSTPTAVPTTALNLTVDGIDPSQAVQTANGSVPLVAGRPAIVRVTIHVQNSSEPVLGVTAKLHGMRNGVELADSPISPFNDGGSIAAPRTPNRENFGDTLNFQMPATGAATARC